MPEAGFPNTYNNEPQPAAEGGIKPDVGVIKSMYGYLKILEIVSPRKIIQTFCKFFSVAYGPVGLHLRNQLIFCDIFPWVLVQFCSHGWFLVQWNFANPVRVPCQ